jgi:hypothetical protein
LEWDQVFEFCCGVGGEEGGDGECCWEGRGEAGCEVCVVETVAEFEDGGAGVPFVSSSIYLLIEIGGSGRGNVIPWIIHAVIA